MRITIACVLIVVATAALAAKPTRFWNLTDNTVNELMLAPAGTDKYGPNQTLNDKDKTVEHDERVKVIGVPSGAYDVKLTDEKGRKCAVKNVTVKEGDIFSIDEKQLAGNCAK